MGRSRPASATPQRSPGSRAERGRLDFGPRGEGADFTYSPASDFDKARARSCAHALLLLRWLLLLLLLLLLLCCGWCCLLLLHAYCYCSLQLLVLLLVCC